MALILGTRIGPYEVTHSLGAGGMGEVYRARDTKLHRDVALKVLPELFALEPDRLTRFEREAQVLASLNHPNIAAIYGFEETSSGQALVLELVEGPTLADRIARGPIPVDEALAIARQIAEALEAAHEHGIVHRDLKPSNIKLRPDGTVKVLDFGLAKALEGDIAAADVSHSPTLLEAAGTRAGVILGTAAYMAPEQAKGIAVDRRADIFAFGAVLYEMLTGRRAFPGDTTTEILAAVLKGEPDWTLLPKDTPEAVRRVLRRCLQKDRSRRLQTAGDARIEIEDALTGQVPLPAREGGVKRRLNVAWIATTLALAITTAALAALYFRSAPADAPETRTEIVTPATSDPTSFALSPDGRQLVFVASGDGLSRLWLRSLAGTGSQPLAGTEGARAPFWSPDTRSVGFFADGKLKRLDIGGGSPQVLANAYAFGGGTWNADGIILFAPSNNGPVFRIPASGGEAVAVTRLDRQTVNRLPQFLPDGRQFLFYSLGTPETSGIYVGSLDSGDVKRLTAANTAGMYAPSGWLLWVRAGTLVGQRLDLERRELAGDPVTVADGVGFANSVGAFSVSTAGLVAYRPGRAGRRQLIWFDRAGKALGTLGAPEEPGPYGPEVSPDGRRVAVSRTVRVQANANIWLLDGTRTSRLTFAAGGDIFPLWSADGSRVAFGSARNGKRQVYMKASSGAGDEQLLLELPPESAFVINDWSPDGRFVLYHSQDARTSRDLWILPMEGDRKPTVFLKTNFDEAAGQFSPDGRWVAYQSNETGRYEIYVRPFAAPAAPGSPVTSASGKWQVSTAGGMFARWRLDGKELYYIGPDGQMMAAAITVTGTTLEPGTPVALFHTRIFGGGTDNGVGRQYDVARDGRFLINTISEDVASPITLIQNWKPPAQ